MFLTEGLDLHIVVIDLAKVKELAHGEVSPWGSRVQARLFSRR
jgi:hypothetical protein